MRFPPINLFSAPKQLAICKHTHWAVYVSWRKKTCIDCGLDRPLYDMSIQHQR